MSADRFCFADHLRRLRRVRRRDLGNMLTARRRRTRRLRSARLGTATASQRPPRQVTASDERRIRAAHLPNRTGRRCKTPVAARPASGAADSVPGHAADRVLPGAGSCSEQRPRGPGLRRHTSARSRIRSPVGKPQTISVGVTVEADPIPDFEIGCRPSCASIASIPQSASASPVMVRPCVTEAFRSIPIRVDTCRWASPRPTKGAFGIPVTQRRADGTVVVRGTTAPVQALNPLFGQVVYAGVKPPPSPSPSSGGASTVTYLGIAFVAVALLALVGLGIRSWRNRGAEDEVDEIEDERDAELQSTRLEEFKKQTRDRAAPNSSRGPRGDADSTRWKKAKSPVTAKRSTNRVPASTCSSVGNGNCSSAATGSTRPRCA